MPRQFVYLPNELLKQYFSFSENIYFLNLDYYVSIPQERFLYFLKKCGVKDSAWRIDNDPKFSEEKMIKLRKEGNNGAKFHDVHRDKKQET